MFKCGFCKKSSEPGVRAHKVITKKRPKTYHPSESQRAVDAQGDYISTQGWEIVTETHACGKCADILRAKAAAKAEAEAAAQAEPQTINLG